MKSWTYLCVLLIMTMLGACSNNDDAADTGSPSEQPVFMNGQIVTSEFKKDGIVIESMIDTIVNLGSEDAPALFYVNGEHTLNGIPMENGNQVSNVFRSLTRLDLYEFIVIWGRVFGINVDLNDNSETGIARKNLAFLILQDYLRQNDVDLPLLVALCKGPLDLKSAVKLVDATRSAANTKGEINSPNTANNILRSIELSGTKPSELIQAIQSKGLTEKSFMNLVNQKGIDLAATLKNVTSTRGEVTEVVNAVLDGLVKLSKILIEFIENGAPVVDIEDTYVSYLHQDDPNVMNYISSADPIERCGMIVKSVRCSGGMHVEGSTKFDIPTTIGSNDNPIASTSGTVTLKYGDCCCFARVATLTFDLSGDQGYVETMWKPQAK
jgi:hypothetical protein